MEALWLLTHSALLRKLDLSCLTAGPLISSVNCRRLCRRGFYRHIPLLKSSHFMTISINSLRDNLRSLWGWWKDHLGGCCLTLQHLADTHLYTHTQTHPHTFIYIHDELCALSVPLPPAQWWKWFRFFPGHQGREDAECWMSLQMMRVLVQVNLYLQLNHLTEHRPLY